MNRRHVLYGLSAVAAGLAGVGLGLFSKRSPQAQLALWDWVFETPTGQSLALAKFRGHPLLINFWATWCPPCVDELPLLNHFYLSNQSRGWQVLGLAVDQKSLVQRYLEKQALHFPVAVVGAQGMELSRSLGNIGSVLPFSLFLGADGRFLQGHTGKLSATDLSLWSTGEGDLK